LVSARLEGFTVRVNISDSFEKKLFETLFILVYVRLVALSTRNVSFVAMRPVGSSSFSKSSMAHHGVVLRDLDLPRALDNADFFRIFD
jgi:hypothetical protein